MTFLLRNTSCFDSDEQIKPFITSGHAILVKGDALVEADVKNALETAFNVNKAGIDAIIFTVGE